MGVINQPMNQIKLTNVSVVRLKEGKKRFEIACYQNKLQDWKNHTEKDIDEVLQIMQVFTNVSKGEVAKKKDILKFFGTSEMKEVILKILDKGEIQLNEKERVSILEQKHNELLNIISLKCINSITKKKHPKFIIEQALNELKFNLDSNKSVKIQLLEAIKLLISKQIIPISRGLMKVKLLLNEKIESEFYESNIKQYVTELKDKLIKNDSVEYVIIIDPSNLKKIEFTLTSKYNSEFFRIDIIDMLINNAV